MADTPEFAVGSLVNVASRTWPGINKPGGVAKINRIHYLPGSSCEDVCQYEYDVKYVLGGSEKRVAERFISSTDILDPLKVNHNQNREIIRREFYSDEAQERRKAQAITVGMQMLSNTSEEAEVHNDLKENNISKVNDDLESGSVAVSDSDASDQIALALWKRCIENKWENDSSEKTEARNFDVVAERIEAPEEGEIIEHESIALKEVTNKSGEHIATNNIEAPVQTQLSSNIINAFDDNSFKTINSEKEKTSQRLSGTSSNLIAQKEHKMSKNLLKRRIAAIDGDYDNESALLDSFSQTSPATKKAQIIKLNGNELIPGSQEPDTSTSSEKTASTMILPVSKENNCSEAAPVGKDDSFLRGVAPLDQIKPLSIQKAPCHRHLIDAIKTATPCAVTESSLITPVATPLHLSQSKTKLFDDYLKDLQEKYGSKKLAFILLLVKQRKENECVHRKFRKALKDEVFSRVFKYEKNTKSLLFTSLNFLDCNYRFHSTPRNETQEYVVHATDRDRNRYLELTNYFRTALSVIQRRHEAERNLLLLGHLKFNIQFRKFEDQRARKLNLELY